MSLAILRNKNLAAFAPQRRPRIARSSRDLSIQPLGTLHLRLSANHSCRPPRESHTRSASLAHMELSTFRTFSLFSLCLQISLRFLHIEGRGLLDLLEIYQFSPSKRCTFDFRHPTFAYTRANHTPGAPALRTCTFWLRPHSPLPQPWAAAAGCRKLQPAAMEHSVSPQPHGLPNNTTLSLENRIVCPESARWCGPRVQSLLRTTFRLLFTLSRGLLTGVVSAEVLKWMSSIKRDLRRRWHESGTLRCTLLLLARRAVLGALSGCCC